MRRGRVGEEFFRTVWNYTRRRSTTKLVFSKKIPKKVFIQTLGGTYPRLNDAHATQEITSDEAHSWKVKPPNSATFQDYKQLASRIWTPLPYAKKFRV